MLNALARARQEGADALTFRLLQKQAVAVGQRRVEVMVAMAAVERAPGRT